MSKRPAEDEDSDTKRVKTEDLLDDELNTLLSQVGSADDGASSGPTIAANDAPIDFNNLPDELLDSVDSMPTPELTGTLSKLPESPRFSRGGATADLRRTFSQPQMRPQPTSAIAAAAAAGASSNDPTKLNDALAAAGVDIHQEEELLQRRPRFGYAQLYAQPQRQGSFLVPYHVANFMQRAAREYGVSQSFYQDLELLEIMSAACENWLSNVVTKTIIMSRHRRGAMAGSKKAAAVQRSEVSKELRNLANKQKDLEERRVNRRMALGLEKNEAGKDENNKVGAEETLHKATNATAAMMTLNPSRKKYSWMTSAAGVPDTQAIEKDTGSKKSQIIAARGDNGLRFREIRPGQSVTMKDLLAAIEDERFGVERAVIKGYCNLRD